MIKTYEWRVTPGPLLYVDVLQLSTMQWIFAILVVITKTYVAIKYFFVITNQNIIEFEVTNRTLIRYFYLRSQTHKACKQMSMSKMTMTLCYFSVQHSRLNTAHDICHLEWFRSWATVLVETPQIVDRETSVYASNVESSYLLCGIVVGS